MDYKPSIEAIQAAANIRVVQASLKGDFPRPRGRSTAKSAAISAATKVVIAVAQEMGYDPSDVRVATGLTVSKYWQHRQEVDRKAPHLQRIIDFVANDVWTYDPQVAL